MSSLWSYIFGGSTKSVATGKATGTANGLVLNGTVAHKEPTTLSTDDWIIVDSSENGDVTREVREEEFETIAESVASLAEFTPTLGIDVCHVSLEDLKEVIRDFKVKTNPTTVVTVDVSTPTQPTIEQNVPIIEQTLTVVDQIPTVDEVATAVAIPPPVTARMLGIVGSKKSCAVVISRKSVRNIQKQRNRITQYSKPHNNQAKINCRPLTYARDSKPASKPKRQNKSKR